ncbi:MAG: cysteine desulfurase [Chloroflexi bacterium]|nr:cysteine desulfurase [Chloroflexota bacterium]
MKLAESVSLDPYRLREDFPIFSQKMHGKPLVYLDNTASAQKPRTVIEAMDTMYREVYANVHRGIYELSERATQMYEDARRKVAHFIHARSRREIVFVRNTTEAINLVAYTWGLANLRPGDEVLITEMEHHSNIVPWQLICQRTGATLRWVPITEDGHLNMEALDSLLGEHTRIFAFTAMSNVLGTINPVAELVRRAHAVGALALVDGAQSVPHLPTDVQAWDADFVAFSSHKMLGPTGIGVLYAKRHLLEGMPPFMGGGEMIREVTMTHATWNEVPYKFEAGTPAFVEAVGLGAAVDYLSGLGMDRVHELEQALVDYAYERLHTVEGLRIIGPGPKERGGVLSFTLDDVHPHDVAAILDQEGIAVRAGHHCAQPIHDRYDLVATTRASFYIYNTREDVDRLTAALHRVAHLFRG